MSWAKLHSGIILPEQLARSVFMETFVGNPGAYRSASATNKNTLGWNTSDGSADADTLADLPTLRRQSRDLLRNDALAAGAINNPVTAVVSAGIVPQSRLDHEFLGISQEEAEAWQRDAERLFMHWANSPAADSARRLTFWKQQEIIYRAKLESGDVAAVRRYLDRPGRLLRTCFQTVEADRLATPPGLSADPRVRAGVRTDENGQPVEYFFANKHPGDTALRAVSNDDFSAVPAFDRAGDPVVLLVANRRRPDQTRGVPYLAPVIEPLKQLGRYSEAEITAAVISSMFAVFVTSPAPTGPLGPGIPGQVGGKQVTPPGTGLQKLQSGMMIDLAPGEEIKVAEANRPNTAFDPFVLAVLRQIGTALEQPFEVLVKHFTASYSAARAALMEAWRFYLREREDLNSDFNTPVWAAVIGECVARGYLRAPGFFENPLRREAWLACDWIGAGVPQIDPLKEAQAAKAWNDLGIWSRQDICAQQGRDFDRVHAQLVREDRMRKADDLFVPQPGQVVPGVGDTPATPKKDSQK